MARKAGCNRQRFELGPAGGDHAAEIDRLVSLGAIQLESAGDGASVLADPDGNEFAVNRS